MRNAMRVVVALVGLFNLAIGLGFLVDPAGSGAKFFVAANGIQGLATMRADFTAFFVTGASLRPARRLARAGRAADGAVEVARHRPRRRGASAWSSTAFRRSHSSR